MWFNKDRQGLEKTGKTHPNSHPENVIDFYGGRFRCQFLDSLLRFCADDETRGYLLAFIWQISRVTNMSGEIALVPDTDLGHTLDEDFDGFVHALKVHYAKHGVKNLFRATPAKGQIIFLVSRFYEEANR